MHMLHLFVWITPYNIVKSLKDLGRSPCGSQPYSWSLRICMPLLISKSVAVHIQWWRQRGMQGWCDLSKLNR